MKHPVRFTLYKKQSLGFLTPVTGKPDNYFLHSKENGYLVGILSKQSGKWVFNMQGGGEDKNLAEQFGAILDGL